MPGYNYRCGKCKQITKLTLPISTDPKKLQECKCGYAMHRVIIETGSFPKNVGKVFAGDWFKKQYGHEMGEKPTNRKEYLKDLKKARGQSEDE